MAAFAVACGGSGQGTASGSNGSEFSPPSNHSEPPPGNPYDSNPGQGGGGGTGNTGNGGTGGGTVDCVGICTQCGGGAACQALCAQATQELLACLAESGGDCTKAEQCANTGSGGAGGVGGGVGGVGGGIGGVGGIGGGTGACAYPDCTGCDAVNDPCGTCLCATNNNSQACTSYCG